MRAGAQTERLTSPYALVNETRVDDQPARPQAATGTT